MKNNSTTSNTTRISWTIPVTSGTTTNLSVSGSGGSGGIISSTSYPNATSSHFVNAKGAAVLEIPNSDKPGIKINGDIEWNGERLQERLERIETLLNIPTRDVIMEEKYEKLRSLSNQYKQALEEYKTWERLKNSK